MMGRLVPVAVALALAGTASATEVTLKNDSLTDFGSAVIVWGFVAGEKAASWLTSPCEGNLVAVQVFWRSPNGLAGEVIHESIDIHRAGSFPGPGELAAQILGPVLNDNVLNEWRYLDENNAIPLSVPVSAGETVIVAFTFAEDLTAGVDPSVVRDTDGIQAQRNALYARLTPGVFQWFDASALGVTGDWVIRAVVDCPIVSSEADVSVTMTSDPVDGYVAGEPLEYTIVVANAGPANASGTTLVDIFPAAYQVPTWTCTTSGGATCPAGGSGNITGTVNLPADSQIEIVVNGTVAPDSTATLSNTVTAVVSSSVTDPDGSNNSATLDLDPAIDDTIFADGFESAGPDFQAARLVPRPATSERRPD